MVKLINGDCFEILESVERNSIDCVICDPPYNINYTKWDKSFDLPKAVELVKPLLKENANVILFQGWTNAADAKLLLDKHFNICNWIVWDRLKGRGATNNLMSTREDIFGIVMGLNLLTIKYIRTYLRKLQVKWDSRTVNLLEHSLMFGTTCHLLFLGQRRRHCILLRNL